MLSIILLAILAVCYQDEIGLPSSSGQGEFTVEDAKEFFENNVDALSVDLQLPHTKSGKMTREQTQGKNRVITPVWNKSERRTERNENMEVVETPLSIGNGVSVMRDMLYKGKRKVEISQTYSKLVTRHFRKENVTVSHIVTFIADKRFSGRDKDITKLRYNNWKKFSGFVLYTFTDGRFANGYKMINGKITHRLYLRELTENASLSTADVRMVYDYVDNSEVTPAFMSDFEKYYCGICQDWFDWDVDCGHNSEIVGDKNCEDCGLPKEDCVCNPTIICSECGKSLSFCTCGKTQICDFCHQSIDNCICSRYCDKCGKYGCDGTCDEETYYCFKCGSPYCNGSCDDGSGGGETDSEELEKELNEHKQYSKILSSEIVMEQFRKAWAKMLEDATSTQRRENGGWIYYNVIEHRYCMGTLIDGVWTSNPGGNSSVNTGSPSYSANGVPKGSVAVAFFHVHTTLSDAAEGTGTKVVGPSPTDIDALKDEEIGFVLDYTGNYNEDRDEYVLYSGHAEDAPSSIYVYNKTGVIKKQVFNP